MKRLFAVVLGCCCVGGIFSGWAQSAALCYENRFSRPLGEVLREVSDRFGVRLKIEVDTAVMLDFANSRIRAYSLEETLDNLLKPFDYVCVKQSDTYYKIKNYEVERARRTAAEGKRMLDFLEGLYTDRAAFEARRDRLRAEVRDLLGIDDLLAQCVDFQQQSKQGLPKVILSKPRRMAGYTVQNIALQTLPGLYVTGSIYAPAKKGRHPVILCPNGHFGNGRYREDQQQRMGTLARMGAVCIDYDLIGWGENVLQLGAQVHWTSAAQVLQLLNGIRLLDYAVTRSDVDPTRVGVCGGSGGGTQTILLTVLDERYTAACPVVSLSAHFDGGCACESGLPVTDAGEGTCNAELAALFAPRPMCVVSDGKDWTAAVPQNEYPYLQRVYGLYGAADRVSNVHLPAEGHDFGPNKRRAVYDFFAAAFGLDAAQCDEKQVTIEPFEAMYSFGPQGEGLPEGAVRSFAEIASCFPKGRYNGITSVHSIEKRAAEWVASLGLTDQKKADVARTAILNHLKNITKWHNEHPYTSVPAGINPRTGETLRDIDREIIAESAQPKEWHEKLMRELRRVLTEEQVEAILDKYTVGKVAFTLKGYEAIVPDMTEEERAFVLEQLKWARERAIDFKRMKAISEIFGMAKDRCEEYFNTHGRNWRQMYSDYYRKRQAEKAAEKARAAQEKR